MWMFFLTFSHQKIVNVFQVSSQRFYRLFSVQNSFVWYDTYVLTTLDKSSSLYLVCLLLIQRKKIRVHRSFVINLGIILYASSISIRAIIIVHVFVVSLTSWSWWKENCHVLPFFHFKPWSVIRYSFSVEFHSILLWKYNYEKWKRRSFQWIQKIKGSRN